MSESFAEELQKEYNDKRFYVVLQEKYHTPNGIKVISPGMACAQTAHVVSKLRFDHFYKKYLVVQDFPQGGLAEKLLIFENVSITTVVLLCRDKRELEHVDTLAIKEGLDRTTFVDENDEFWGKGMRVTTALAIGPCRKEEAQLAVGYLPLYHCGYWPHKLE